jgi:molecular chaperone GrpE
MNNDTPNEAVENPNIDASDEVTELRRQIDDLKEQYLRSQAEFANFQKRAKAQIEADRQYSIGNLALELLGVLDNFERANDAARQSGASSIVDGLEMVQKQFHQVLAKQGVQPIEAVGHLFDPNLHEALMRVPDPDRPEGTIVQELARGYRLHDRVLRPSRVAISSHS